MPIYLRLSSKYDYLRRQIGERNKSRKNKTTKTTVIQNIIITFALF